jgi:spoIIIJ-associated protein
VPETVQESGADQDEAKPVGDPVVAETTADGEVNAEAEADEETDGEDGEDRSGNEDLLVREGDIAGDYLERLLDLVDYDGDIDLDVEAGRAIVSIDGGDDLEKLVGPRGNVLEALQELTRLAVQQETGARSRLMLDVAGWRADRRQELRDLGRATAERVLAGDDRIRLQPMTPFERKVVHDAVAAVDGVHSESEGEDPRRRVVVFRKP